MTPERIAKLRQVLDRRQPDLTVVTDFVHKQRNTSAIVRVCDAVGIMSAHAVVAKKDYKAFRGTAMGSHRWVKVIRHESLQSALKLVRAQGMQVVAAHLDHQSADYRDIDYTQPTAVLLGAEKHGVSEQGIASVDHCITVPMVGMVGSYNVSVAAGIILTEARNQRERAGLYQRRRIDEADYQRLFFEWGHPAVQKFCMERGVEYPALNEEGEIDNPSAWYASVRERLRALEGEGEREK